MAPQSGSLAIVNNGGANMNSLLYALERLNIEAVLTADADTIRNASHVILPGVGHARDSMLRLMEHDLATTLRTLTQPVLGICLGMQLLFERSDEGNTSCLGVVAGTVETLPGSVEQPSPHMGWNQIHFNQPHPLFTRIDSGTYFYFVHGYTAEVNSHTLAQTHYGRAFASVAGRDNFIGVQFHPERSGDAGAQLLTNFLQMT
ncbi:MAG: imidazole glycerol phosphate synthase subunit HisH [Pseudomonadota bacterium]